MTPEHEALALQHAPELRYHPIEAHRADAAAVITDSYLAGNYSNGLVGRDGAVVAMANPIGRYRRLSLNLLVGEDEHYWEGGPQAHHDDNLVAHAGTLQWDSQRMHGLPGYGDVAYCRLAYEGDQLRWLQYWLFYYTNPPFHGLFGEHVGDWECVQIDLDDARQPAAGVYHQHEGAVRRDWADLPTLDSAGVVPIVYVAKNSHASYFEPGRHRRILGAADDHCSDQGEHVRPRVVILDEAVDRWIAWPGQWGHSKGSPVGPGRKGYWKDPNDFEPPLRLVIGLRPEDIAAEPAPLEPVLTARLELDAVVVEAAWPDRPQLSLIHI